MNPRETQSDSLPEETYFDLETPDSSEEQFSASLGFATASGRPEFVMDSKEPAGSHSFGEQRWEEPHQTPGEPHGEAHESSAENSEAKAQSGSDWRDIVSAKVKNYKSRKPRKERYPSLQLQFDPVVPWKSDPSPMSVAEQSITAQGQHFAETVFEPETRARFQVTTEATARVLEFPRPGTLPFNRDELAGQSAELLAEPVNDRPRIIEAPELLPPPPALGGILIEPVRVPEPERQPGVDMPLQTASISRRVSAAALDGFFVAHALAIFGFMFLRFNPVLPPMRETAEITAGLAVLLWFSYQFAFLTFTGTTPGIRAARMRITHFDGTPVLRSVRRWRVFASVLSGISLGLGYAWCFLDEDQLSWHDRITKTHLSPRTS